MTRTDSSFLVLVLGQGAHSIEEYVGRLYDVFPPARFVTGLVSSDRARGFLIINVALVSFGLWCFWWPLRRRWPSALALAWLWGRYTPGVATAPLLLGSALYLARQLGATTTEVATRSP